MKKKSIVKTLIIMFVVCLTALISGCGKTDYSGQWIEVMPENQKATSFEILNITKNGDFYALTREVMSYNPKEESSIKNGEQIYNYICTLVQSDNPSFKNVQLEEKDNKLTIVGSMGSNVYTYNPKEETLTSERGIVYKRDKDLLTKNIAICKDAIKQSIEKNIASMNKERDLHYQTEVNLQSYMTWGREEIKKPIKAILGDIKFNDDILNKK